MDSKPRESKDKKSNYKVLIIAFFAILLIINGVKFYLDHQKDKEQEAKIANVEAERDETLNKLESISNELDMKIEEINKLGGDVEELRKIRSELEAEKEQIRRAAYIEAGRLKEKVQGYEVLLKKQDEEIARLKIVNEELLSENTGLKTEKIKLSDSLSNLQRTKEKLGEKVALASRLKAENIKIFALNKREREREGEFRNRQIEQLKVQFNLAENNVAPIEGKDIKIRIVGPEGDVLFDVARGSGTFMADGEEKFYTANQEILFDNTRQELVFIYDKGSDYNIGKHTVEIYADNYKIGEGSFIVK